MWCTVALTVALTGLASSADLAWADKTWNVPSNAIELGSLGDCVELIAVEQVFDEQAGTITLKVWAKRVDAATRIPRAGLSSVTTCACTRTVYITLAR